MVVDLPMPVLSFALLPCVHSLSVLCIPELQRNEVLSMQPGLLSGRSSHLILVA